MLSSVKVEELSNHDRISWIVFSKELVLVDTASNKLPGHWVTQSVELKEHLSNAQQLHDLDGNKLPVFVIDLGAEEPCFDGLEFTSLRQVMMTVEEGAFDVVGRAWQFVHFYRTHKYCGQCGFTTTRVTWETAVQCKTCGHRCYPRVSPCIIVGIYRKGEILLALNARHTSSNMYSVLAGFVESGESLENAVAREIFEEVGVKVTDIQYVDSQPWPFPHALMVGYVAKWESGEIKPDEKEILDAQWFSVNDLPVIPPKFSIAGRLIEQVVNVNSK
ncbi:NAD(+) diphosphatase [Alteromonas sp. 5E99-2]|uniref:NAD(+) diphosphatase n=1 Tax=Alteromonas sp. 5E99-2 TaxID=2817683 RepID=UPI001A98FA11|nr:NAD(+) diphosphatase [Alteromonas sp. 5E99-2]MBO1255799.1 NAD(+) diphosphatase [Alteromonas sp. 5E99-2]